MMNITCATCRLDKSIEEFYLRDGLKPFRRCKACISAAKPKKPIVPGYQLLSQETRDGIQRDLQDRTKTMKAIAQVWNVNYPNLTYWVRNKLL